MALLYVFLLIVGTFTAMAVYALYAVWGERKVAAAVQDRLGPTEVGPYGLFQSIADILKLLHKEHIVPNLADKPLFALAPFIVFASVFGGFAVLPLAPGLVGSNLNVAVLYLLAVVSIEVVGLLMAGWASNNKYALLGAVRSVAQIVSYEIPAGLTLLAAVLAFGSLSLVEINLQQGVWAQGPVYLLGVWDVSGVGGITGWAILRYPHLLIAFILFFTASLAETNRAPFDIPEAESELVSGFHVEYSGLRFGMFFLAEYGNMLLMALVASTLFLGGWNTLLPNLTTMPAGWDARTAPLGELFSYGQLAYLTSGAPGTTAGVLWGLFWLLLKAGLLIFVMMWVRWSLPRLRPDQLLRLCWKYLTPLALGCVVLSAIWKVLEVYAHA